MRKANGKQVAGVVGILALILLSGTTWLSWPQLVFWYQFESLGANAQGLGEFKHRQSGIVFVRIPAGEFLMGASEEEIQEAVKSDPGLSAREFARESPQHRVRLSTFLIAKYEVTQDQWSAVQGENPSEFKGSSGPGKLPLANKAGKSLPGRLPVENVSWDECQQFCKKLGLKLPTEAQWEYACRAGSKTPFSFGETITPEQVNYDGNSPEVGSLPPNAFGLHEMHGNVWEWCEDIYDESFYSKPAASGPDPVCTTGSGDRVLRGGAWILSAWFCRSACRGTVPASERLHCIGFRPARPLPRGFLRTGMGTCENKKTSCGKRKPRPENYSGFTSHKASG